jgi:hypothetical protein
LPSTERVETVSGVGTPREPPRAPLRHLWITNLCAAPSRVPAQLQSKNFDARRRLESRCLGIPCAPRKCTRVFFRSLVGYQPQLLNRAHDAAPGPQSLSSPQPNKSRLNTSAGFFPLCAALPLPVGSCPHRGGRQYWPRGCADRSRPGLPVRLHHAGLRLANQDPQYAS